MRLTVYNAEHIAKYCSAREGERRIWQALSFIPNQCNNTEELTQALKDAADFGKQYVLIGLPEDIGPRANLGNGGAELGWQAFLSRFLNLQANQYIAAEKVILLGEVDFSEQLKKASLLNNKRPDDLVTLRALCSELDDIASPILAAIFAAGLEPIVIGGGHNNCYPILKALSETKQQAVSAINLDPHADFRALEGRHSGNGFHYAFNKKYLSKYHVIGMHELKNNQTILDSLASKGFGYHSYQSIFVRREIGLSEAISCGLEKVTNNSQSLGVEVDVDSISFMPVSAYTNCGVTTSDAEHFVYKCALSPNASYLHLCEAAPKEHAAGVTQGLNEAGQVLSALVTAYISGREKSKAT
jgi:formiminoglutamase